MSKLSGIFPPIPTPFVGGELAPDKLAFNIAKWNETAIRGYVVFGSNGESVFLTRDEKVTLIESVKENAGPEKVIIAGTGSDSIKDTVSLTNEVADLGADYALVVTPSYYKSEMNHDSFVMYFTMVADAVKIPVIVYNVPKFTGVDMEVETVAQLSEHRNIAGIKNSTENMRQLIEFVTNTPDDFSVIAGTASVLYNGLISGATGGIIALANIAADDCVNIQKLVEAGKMPEALVLQERLIPVNKAITSQYGVAGLKAAMDMLGYFGGEPRAPLMTLEDGVKENIRRILSRSDLL